MASLFCNNGDNDDVNVLLQVVPETNKRKFQKRNNNKSQNIRNGNITIKVMPILPQEQQPYYAEPPPPLPPSQFGLQSLAEQLRLLSLEGELPPPPPQPDLLFLQQQQQQEGGVIHLSPFILQIPPILHPSVPDFWLQPPPLLIQPPPMPISFFTPVY